MPFLVLHALASLAAPGYAGPHGTTSGAGSESDLNAMVGILAVACVVLLVVAWIGLKWLSRRAARRAESNITTTSL